MQYITSLYSFPYSSNTTTVYHEEVRHMLESHFSRVVSTDTYQRINVRRQFLLQDAMAAFQRKTIDPSKLLRVHFVGESAVNSRREFLQLMIGALFTDAGLFEGYPSSVAPIHNIVALSSNKFALAGKMLATSIIQVQRQYSKTSLIRTSKIRARPSTGQQF